MRTRQHDGEEKINQITNIKVETGKQEFACRHEWLILAFQLKWAYQYSHLLNLKYQKVICGVFFEWEMSNVTGYLIPQLSPKTRERQLI